MTTVFVYGSLKRGFGNARLLSESRYLGDAVSIDRFRMWGWGFPYIAASEDGLPVAGELYEVDEATLANLDRLEGHPRHYCRQHRWFVVDDAKVAPAWVYVAGPGPASADHDDDDNARVDTSNGVLRWAPTYGEQQ
jgi:gamma-glutamylaminecyclotransferase